MDIKPKVRSGIVGSLSGFVAVAPKTQSIVALIGLSGLPGDVQTLLKVLAMIPEPVAYVAATVFVFFAWARWGDAWARWWEAVKSWWGSLTIRIDSTAAIVILVVIAAFAMWAFLPETPNTPKKVWTHPDLSSSEQIKIHAECDMKALKAITRGGAIERGMDQRRYKRACLTSEGFVLRQADDVHE